MAKIKISGEQAFQVEASIFAIGPSESGYTLNYSADGVNYIPWDDATLPEKTQVVANAALGMYFKLVDNTSENVTVTW